MGESDELIPLQSSTAVADCFSCREFVTHSGGHLVPATAPVRNALKQFVSTVLNERRSRVEAADSVSLMSQSTPCSMSSCTNLSPFESLANEVNERWAMWKGIQNRVYE